MVVTGYLALRDAADQQDRDLKTRLMMRKPAAWRIPVAFAIAPMVPSVLALIASIMTDGPVMYEFTLGIGAIVGYGFAILVGGPAYLVYFRHLQPVRWQPFAVFVLICLLGYCLFFGSIMVAQSGPGALLSATFLGYGLIFFLATSVSVSAFYLIGFKRFGGKTGAKKFT